MKRLIAAAALFCAVMCFSACSAEDLVPSQLKIAVLSENSGETYSQSVEYAKRTAEKTGLPYTVVECGTDYEIMELLQTGGADFAVPTVQRTNQIGSDYLVTVPYMTVNMCVVYSGSSYKYNRTDFDSTLTAVSTEFSELANEEKGEYPLMSKNEAINALKSGQISAYFCTAETAVEISQSGEYKENVLYDAEAQTYVFAVKKGRNSLKAMLDEAIYKLY